VPEATPDEGLPGGSSSDSGILPDFVIQDAVDQSDEVDAEIGDKSEAGQGSAQYKRHKRRDLPGPTEGDLKSSQSSSEDDVSRGEQYDGHSAFPVLNHQRKGGCQSGGSTAASQSTSRATGNSGRHSSV
jgi:hypothetical protein